MSQLPKKDPLLAVKCDCDQGEGCSEVRFTLCKFCACVCALECRCLRRSESDFSWSSLLMVGELLDVGTANGTDPLKEQHVLLPSQLPLQPIHP